MICYSSCRKRIQEGSWFKGSRFLGSGVSCIQPCWDFVWHSLSFTEHQEWMWVWVTLNKLGVQRWKSQLPSGWRCSFLIWGMGVMAGTEDALLFLSRSMTCSSLCEEGVPEERDFIPSSTYLCCVIQCEISSLCALTLQPVKWVSHWPSQVDVGRMRAHLWSTQDSPWFKWEAERGRSSVRKVGSTHLACLPGSPYKVPQNFCSCNLLVYSMDMCSTLCSAWSLYWQACPRNLFCIPEHLDKMFFLAHRSLFHKEAQLDICHFFCQKLQWKLPMILRVGDSHRLARSHPLAQSN